VPETPERTRTRWLADLTPLRENPAYRRLWIGVSLGNVGQQLAVVTLSLQVYALTRSSAAVGLVGLVGLVPLAGLGLYGGSVVDTRDRRRVALVTALALYVVSVTTAVQAWAHVGSVTLLYALVAVQSALYAVNSPARSSIIPMLVRRDLLPAANALSSLSMTLGFTVGPMLAGLLVGWFGFGAAYSVDVVTYLASLWGVWGLPPLPPLPPEGVGEGSGRRAGVRSVLAGLSFLATRPNVRMTFLVDLCAMVLAQPRALFPAIGAVVLGGGPRTAGLLIASVALGSVVAGLFSGPLGRVRRQGVAVLACVVGWGLSVAAFGLVVVLALGLGGTDGTGVGWLLVPAAVCLALAGAADAVSAVFRATILQAATPDALRGRLQGVFVVVVAGGPRLGDLVAGSGGDVLGEGWTALAGGLACALAVLALARCQPRFARYDALDPQP